MALSIGLSDDHGTPFTPGSLVVGVVQFTSREDQVFTALTIDFRGWTGAVLNQHYGELLPSRSSSVSRTYLFSRHLDLHVARGTQQRGTYVWPFAFRIPLFASPRAVSYGSDDFFELRAPFQGDGALVPHPLPPSMQHTGRFACHVRYVLNAALVHRPLPRAAAQAQPKAQTAEASLAISVQSLNLSLPEPLGPEWPYVAHRRTVHWPAADHAATRYIFHRICGHAVQNDARDPQERLCFSVMLPRQQEIKGRPALSIPVSCTMECLAPCPDVGESFEADVQSLVLHSFKVSLLQHLHVRAGRHYESSSKRIWTRRGSCVVPIVPNKPEGASARDAAVNLADVFDLVFPAGLLTSDFSTYNISRSHSLDIDCCIQYRGKSRKMKLRRIPLSVVPQFRGEHDRRLNQSLEPDDEYGCRLLGIRWQNDGETTIGHPFYDAATPYSMREGSTLDDDLCPGTPPPAYVA